MYMSLDIITLKGDQLYVILTRHWLVYMSLDVITLKTEGPAVYIDKALVGVYEPRYYHPED